MIVTESNGHCQANGTKRVSSLTHSLRRYHGLPPLLEQVPTATTDINTDWRALSQALRGLARADLPSREAFLKDIGLSKDALSAHQCITLAQTVNRVLDMEQDEDEAVSEWKVPEVRDTPPSKLGINTRRLSDVTATPLEWLWPQRFPLGKLTLLSGDPGLGKTWVVLDLIARVTTGRPLPDASDNPFGGQRRNVLWISAEDDDADTILPRLTMLQADTSRVHSQEFVVEKIETSAKNAKDKDKTYKDQESMLDLNRHMRQLDEWLTNHPLVVMVALDPFTAFLGKIDSHRNSDVRALMTPLAKLASKHRVAIVGINHLNKGEGENALYRGMGSIAFVAAARSSWMVSKDPKEKDRRLLTLVKGNNNTEDIGGLAFRVGAPHNGISWEQGAITTTADEALKVPEKPKGTSAPARAEAEEWLTDLLKNGPVDASYCREKIVADGMCERTIMSAKKRLGVISEKQGGSGAKWVWALPT